ncbi:hypothetical protein DQ384_07395 [Sphaerisporangium album]|uniref:Uncharacterized protein n=1 Tax=Sphaerisporangium album TaxID=509200 RepID=A0A367FPI6_9ACTN|nr:hypothetical protein [Sphaerisporangium album]RCG32313.1 hypothetical protein DQ384_07395 [Sphaerisporangium album]
MRWLILSVVAAIVVVCWCFWMLFNDPCAPHGCAHGEDVPLRVPLPEDPAQWTASLPRSGDGSPYQPHIVKRFARDDVWTFSGDGGLEVTHWDGSRRVDRTPPLPEGFHVEDVEGTASDDLWISGWVMGPPRPVDPTGPDGVVVRWNGHEWRRVPVPANEIQLAPVARDDVWALFDGEIVHWDGHAWSPASMPDIPMPDSLSGEDPGAPLSDVIALGPDDVWAVGTVTTYVCCDQRAYHREVVMHWDGRSWKLLDLEIRGANLGEGFPDGNGGLWIPAHRDGEPLIMLHYRDGRWTKRTLPLPHGLRGPEIGEIVRTDTGRLLLTTTAYTTEGGSPTTVEYSLTS